MDTSKIIRGVVSSGRYTVTAPIVKEDYGLYLKIEGVELPETYQVDFSNSENSGTSVTMIGNADGVLIPHQFIDTGKDIFAFLYHVGADFGRTVYKFRIPNKLRPGRTDDEPTPEEQSVIDQTIAALNEAVESTQDAQEAIENMSVSAQTLAEGESATVTKTESEGVVHLEFGIPKGQTGDTPTITASKRGKTTSIYVGDSEVAQIEDGTDGTNGDDGYSPTANVTKSGKTATITITDKNGTTSAQVEDGTDGTDGVSPTVSITPITGGHRITITDADGEHSADIMDGTGNVDDVQINGTSILNNGVANIPLPQTVTVTGTTPTITAQADTRYVCGEVSTLDITVPASGIIDVIFTSGATATVLTVTPPSGMTMKWANGFDPTALETNTTYELNIMDGLGVACAWS